MTAISRSGRAPQQARGNRGAGRTASDDDDVVAGGRLARIDGASAAMRLDDAGHIETGRTRDFDDVVEARLPVCDIAQSVAERVPLRQ